jgi:hypothetical protein
MVAANAMDAANSTLIRGLIIEPIAVIRATDAVTITDSRVANADRSSPVSKACGDIAATRDAATAVTPRAMVAAA